MASGIPTDPAKVINALREWVLTTTTGKLAAAYAGSFVLAKASDSLAYPYKVMSLLFGLPLIATYVPLRVLFNRWIYPRTPNIPNAPASFEGITRVTQSLFGFLPEGAASTIPPSVFESLAMDVLHPGTRKLWRQVDGPKNGLPDGVKGVWIEDPSLKKGEEDVVLLYFHGGGYCVYSPSEFANFFMCLYASLQAKGKKVRILALDYDLAPHGRFPRQLEQATAAYSHLVKTMGFAPEKIAVGGDSAGANLALVLAIHIASQPAPSLPAPSVPHFGKLVLVSPWIKLYNLSEPIPETHSMIKRDGGDYIGTSLLRYWAHRYAGPMSTSDPWISPLLFPDEILQNALPSVTLVTAGTAETLYDDIEALVKKFGNSKKVEFARGQDKVHDYATLDVTFGLGSFSKEERELGVEQIAKFLA